MNIKQNEKSTCIYLLQMFTGSVGKNGQVGVLKRVYQTVPFLLLNYMTCCFIIKGWAGLVYISYLLFSYLSCFGASLFL